MTGLSMLDGAAGGGAGAIARQLADAARGAGTAAKLAKGDYINPPSLSELQRADKAAGRVIASLEDLLPNLAVAEGGDHGAQVARSAVEQLVAGREVLHGSVAVEDDLVRSGAAVINDIGVGAASSYFSDAAAAVQGIADEFTLRATPVEDIFAAVTRHIR